MFWLLPKNVWNKFILLIMWIQICNMYLPHFFYCMLVFFALQSVFLTRLVHCLHMAFSCWIPQKFSMFSICLFLASCISLLFHLYYFLFSLFVLTYLFFKLLLCSFLFFSSSLCFTIFAYFSWFFLIYLSSKLHSWISHYLSLFVLICPAS